MSDQFYRDEVALLRLFKRAQMRPGQHFYERVTQAPWATQPSVASTRRVAPLRLTAVVLSVAVFLVLVFLPFRSLAQQVFHFFTQAETDVVDHAAFLEPSPAAPVLSDIADVKRASEVAGFAVRLPQELPAELQIVSAGVNPGSVTVTYSAGQTTLIFYQGMKAESTFYVGAGASVEAVLVDGVTGEYVRGGWRQVGDGLVWDNTLSDSLLLWEREGVRYGLLVERGEISQEALVRIANSLP